MRAEIKYLSIGFFIGMGATGLLLTGMLVPSSVAVPTPTETASSTPTFYAPKPPASPILYLPTSTFTPTPTFIQPTLTATITSTPTVTPTVPSPTPTFSNTLMGLLQDGYLSQTGPLDLRGIVRVYEASLKYIRSNSEESRLLGEQINGPGYGAPSDICGPLSISILQDAGLVSADISPHAFWLLNPDIWDDRRMLARAFPSDQFENRFYKIKLNEVDWNQTPLYPGDFVYIYAGTGGNFEHMLVVNRVDTAGRAYAVTNHETPVGFVVSEVLLYNTSNPDAGMFPSWTAKPNAETGSTGFAGFEIWRLRTP